MTTPRKRQKRVHEDGATMSRVRKVVDHDTGETYRVETTREAKRRHQRNGGASYNPTAGQINAADIWNKQEEKIKRDRERDEKRKRAKLKQEANEARQREVQQEKLRAGRISIEDTWGKVNASQNRLHAFFGPPKTPQTNTIPQSGRRHNSNDNLKSDAGAPDEREASEHLSPQDDFLQDLDKVFTASPLSPDVRRSSFSKNQSPCSIATKSSINPQTRSQSPALMSAPQPGSLPPQIMMPPPKRTHTLPPMIKPKHVPRITSNTVSDNEPSSDPRQPLREMSESQMNARANEKPDLLGNLHDKLGHCPPSTQVVREALSGLSSEDFQDDLSDSEKENESSLKQYHTAHPDHSHETYILFGNNKIDEHEMDSQGGMTNKTIEDVFKDSDDEAFDDGDIDDEFLLSLAATQAIKQQFLAQSKRAVGSSIQPELRRLPDKDLFIDHVNAEEPKQAPYAPKLGDSFAMDGINDDDLLEGLEDFETNTLELDTKRNHSSVDEAPMKKRRILPWIKDPISFSFRETDINDGVTPSPLSQLLND